MPYPDQVTIGIYEKALPEIPRWVDRLALAGQAGFDFVELSIDEDETRLGRLDWSGAQRSVLREAVDLSGVKLTSMCLSGQRQYPMGSLEPTTRQRGLDLLRKAVDFAQDVGIRIVLVPGYDVFYEHSSRETRARFLDGLYQAVGWAAPAGVMLALENTDHAVTSIRQTLRYVERIGSPWLQLYGDVGNLVAHGYDPLAELSLGAGHFVGLHVKDALPGKFRDVEFGQGCVPFTRIFRKLWRLGFCGPIMLEMTGGQSADAPQAIARARQWVQARIDESRASPLKEASVRSKGDTTDAVRNAS